MAPRWKIEGDVVELSTGPEFTTAHLLATMQEVVASRTVRPPMKLLFDMSESKENAPHDEIANRAWAAAARPDLICCVGVVVSDAHHFGLARIGAEYAQASGLPVEVFGSLQEARLWLDSDPHERGNG